jgi:membrane protein
MGILGENDRWAKDAARPGTLSLASMVEGVRNQVRRVAALLREAWGEYERDYARYFATAMVYYALYALVPLILLILSVLGLLLRFSDAAATVAQYVLSTVEAGFGAQGLAVIEPSLDWLKQQSVVASAVSLVGLLVTASVLFRHLRLSFRAIWKHEPVLVSGSVREVVRAVFLEYVRSNLIVLFGGLLLLVALVLVAVTQWLGGLLLHVPRVGDTAEWLLALPIPLMLVTLTFAVLFMSLPPVRLAWRHVWLAAVLCGAAWIITAEMLVLYGIFFGSSLGGYGAIGGMLLVMLWLNLVSQLLFFGGELCKVVARHDAGSPVPSAN